MGLGEVEKSWLKRLGVLTENPPFPEEDEKDGGLEESLGEEAAGRRGIAGNGQGEQRIGERLELEPLLHFPRSTSTARTEIGNEDGFFLLFSFFLFSFPLFYAVWSMFQAVTNRPEILEAPKSIH